MINSFCFFCGSKGGLIRYAVYALLLVLSLFALLNIQYGVDDDEMLYVFSTDEGDGVRRLLVNTQDNDLNPHEFFNYGYVYSTVGYGVCKVLASLDYELDVRTLAVVLRSISFGAYLSLLWLLFLFVKRITGSRHTSWACVALLATCKMVYYWGQMIHPDTLQAALILGACLVAWRRHTILRALIASALAGLAFGTKYSGVFVLPFLWLPVALRYLVAERRGFKGWLMLGLAGCGGIVLFGGAWLLTNPYVPVQWPAFLEDLRYETGHVARGHFRAEAGSALRWFQTIYQDVGVVGCLFITLGVLCIGRYGVLKCFRWQLFRSHRGRLLLASVGYVAFSLAHLMITVHMRRPRYTYHFLPLLVLLAGWGLHSAIALLPKRQRVLRVLMLVIVAICLGRAVGAVKNMSWAGRKYQHPSIVASLWIEQEYGTNQRILADVYSYRTPRMKNFQGVWGVNIQHINAFNPTIIMINRRASGRWNWKRQGTSFADLDFVLGSADGAQRIQNVHRVLFGPDSPYEIVYERDDVVILARKKKTDVPRQSSAGRDQSGTFNKKS